MTPPRSAAVVLGSTGYVAGELLRLLSGHPGLELSAAVSRSRSGERLAEVFPHLALSWPEEHFAVGEPLEGLLEPGEGPLAVFCCAPHGESAALIDRLLTLAEERGRAVRVVDVSADFRHPDPGTYAAIYGHPHPAPERLREFRCALPELGEGMDASHVAHPGCFTTCVSLAAAPLFREGLVEPRVFASAVTGSTGSGRTPSAGTHHPERHGNLRAYKPLAHRHAPEMAALLAGAGGADLPEVLFVPHSGPFSRGIHATLHLRLREPLPEAELRERYRRFYAGRPFVTVCDDPPALKDVVGTNALRVSVGSRGRDVVVLSVLDNLTKGAAGGMVQWMNRLLGFEETAGLLVSGPGWT